MFTDFRTEQYICLNRGRLFNSIGNSSVIFSRNNTINQSVSTRRNLNRLLLPMISNKEIRCRENSYNLSDLCHHVCTLDCKNRKVENAPKPCYIEEIATSIDL